MFFWDIPVSATTKELRQPAMLLHHVLMFFTAAVALGFLSGGRPLLAYYAPFFFGAVELSSLPVRLIDSANRIVSLGVSLPFKFGFLTHVATLNVQT
jgi:hypothetical protein